MRGDVSLLCGQHLTVDGPKFTDESTIDNIKQVN